MNIILTGFMGTGKSAVGKLLASRLDWQYFDTDEIIEKEVGMKISKIFANKGEPYFRRMETEAIKLVSLSDNTIISCGGGAVMNPENMQALETNGVVICLTAKPEKIFERTKGNTDRPLLNVEDPVGKINELLKERKKYYKRCSLMIDTSEITVEDVVDKILKDSKIITKLKS